MTDTCREQVLQAIATTLEGIADLTGFTGLVVERERADPVTSDELPRLLLFDDGGPEPPDFSGERVYTLVGTIEGYRAGDTPLAAKQAADELKGQVQKILFADITLGGLTRDIRVSSEPPGERLAYEVPANAAAFTLAFEFDFATSETDPFTFA